MGSLPERIGLIKTYWSAHLSGSGKTPSEEKSSKKGRVSNGAALADFTYRDGPAGIFLSLGFP